jgi:hypothetical protein
MPGGQRFPGPGNQQQRFQHPGRQPFFQPFRAYRQGGNGPVIFDPEFDGKRLRKSAMRKTVDYNAAIIKMLEVSFSFSWHGSINSSFHWFRICFI